MNPTATPSRPIDASYHHGSHRQLLMDVPVDVARLETVDAIIVPTARPVHWLREAMRLAQDLDTVLVAVCSRFVRHVEVLALGAAMGVTTVAADVDEGVRHLPRLVTSDLLERTNFWRRSDTSHKRNLALLLARLVGWQRVFFMDDDIFDISSTSVRAAAGLLDRFDVVGLRNAGYPDNSVVCHINRELGAEQEQFVGAGALAVAPQRTRSFFPNTYNQDWFFLLGEGQPPRVAVTGLMRQKPYDPFTDPDRARCEEFGDCLAEGLYWLLDHDLLLEDADVAHWRDFLSRRMYFVNHLLAEMDKFAGRSSLHSRQIASLEAARTTCAKINPSLCAAYVNYWQADLEIWHRHLESMPSDLGLERASALLKWEISSL